MQLIWNIKIFNFGNSEEKNVIFSPHNCKPKHKIQQQILK